MPLNEAAKLTPVYSRGIKQDVRRNRGIAFKTFIIFPYQEYEVIAEDEDHGEEKDFIPRKAITISIVLLQKNDKFYRKGSGFFRSPFYADQISFTFRPKHPICNIKSPFSLLCACPNLITHTINSRKYYS